MQILFDTLAHFLATHPKMTYLSVFNAEKEDLGDTLYFQDIQDNPHRRDQYQTYETQYVQLFLSLLKNHEIYYFYDMREELEVEHVEHIYTIRKTPNAQKLTEILTYTLRDQVRFFDFFIPDLHILFKGEYGLQFIVYGNKESLETLREYVQKYNLILD